MDKVTITFAVTKQAGDEELLRKLGDWCDEHQIVMYAGDDGTMLGFYFTGQGPAIQRLKAYLQSLT